jgi:hypothetical protein
LERRAYGVYIDGPAGTFGDIQTVVIQPQGQGDFVYGISDTTFLTSSFNGGSTSVTDGVASISTGTNANGSASIKLKRGIKYRPGQGALGRFTALFDTAVANNFQLAGIGNDECGYYVGYNGTSFGVLHNTTAQVEIRTLTITVGAGTGTVTVTLDGTAVDVDVVGRHYTNSLSTSHSWRLFTSRRCRIYC